MLPSGSRHCFKVGVIRSAIKVVGETWSRFPRRFPAPSRSSARIMIASAVVPVPMTMPALLRPCSVARRPASVILKLKLASSRLIARKMGCWAARILWNGWSRQESCRLRARTFSRWWVFASDKPGTQKIPGGLPVRIPDTGNFLGLLANKDSHRVLDDLLASASTYLPKLPVIGLHVTLGLENHFPVLLRSDHAPFWAKKIPATMWTDTSEFRNPYYHEPGDKPDTLNYPFSPGGNSIDGCLRARRL